METPNCPSSGKGVTTQAMGYYSATRNSENYWKPQQLTWVNLKDTMDLESIALSEISQSAKDKYRMI